MTKLIKISASVLSLATAQAALAQQADHTGIQDIVVTATRQATNLQDTPLAITAVTSEDLQMRGLTDASELSNVIPNAAFQKAQGTYGPGMTAFIRGIGQADTGLASEPGVAFYVDDVYYPLLFGSLFDLLDLERVEVLRGPQGTLFGRNALAGAANLVTKTPRIGESSAYAEITVGNYSRREIRAGLNLPIGDTIAVAISGLSKERTGYQKRLDFRCDMARKGTLELAGNFPFSSPNQINSNLNATDSDCVIGDLGGEDVRALRGQLYWEPSSRLNLTITADYLKDDSTNTMDSILTINPAAAAAVPNVTTVFDQYSRPGEQPFAYDERFVTGDPYSTYATYCDTVPAGTDLPGNALYNGSPFRGGLCNPLTTPVNSWGISGKLVFEVAPDIDLTGVVGYRDFSTTYAFDNDGSPLAVENNRNDVFQDHFSAEVRLSGSRPWIDWVAGLFYYEGTGTQRFSGTSPFNGYVRYTDNIYEPQSKAAFANVTIRPLERLSVRLGGRYSDEVKKVDNYNVTDDTDATSTEPTFNPNNSTIFQLDLAVKRFDWKVGLDYEVADRTMVYASAATGFRLPGFNSRPLQPSQVGEIPGDETVSYELGVKSDLFDRRLRVNAAAFFTDYKVRPSGVSGQEYRLDPDTGLPVPGNFIQIDSPVGNGVTNCRPRTAQEVADNVPGFTCIGRAFSFNTPGEVKGFEVELDFQPVDGLSMSGSVGYHKFSAPDLEARPDTANKRPQGIPEWNANAGIQYRFDAPHLQGSVTPRLDWFYTGSQVYDSLRTEFNQAGYSLVNARLSYQNEEHDFTLALGVKNLFDKFYWRNMFIYQSLGRPQINGQPGTPREWYLTVSKRF